MISYRKKAYSILFVALCIVGILFFGFLGIRLHRTIEGPRLSLQDISDGQILTSPLLQFSGGATGSQEISVNGAAVPVNDRGQFSYELLLHPGFNLLVVEARDEIGHTTKTAYALVLHEEENQSYALISKPITTN